MMRVLSLFAGIGGFDLGLERTGGFRTVAFCEIDPFCRRVLAKHWPEVPCYHDVRELTAAKLAADGISVDVICGGFPCQDISVAGRGAGMAGERSGLWSDYARIVGELRPAFVIVENVAALLSRGLGDVLGDLAALGYDAEWHCIPASAIGAHHRRDRLWIVAYTGHGDEPERSWSAGRQSGEWSAEWGLTGRDSETWPLADTGLSASARHRAHGGEVLPQQETVRLSGRGQSLANSDRPRLSFTWTESHGPDWQQGRRVLATSRWWAVEPAVGRVAHGVPDRVGQLRAYGNAVVPQIPELIGRAILEARTA